MYLLPHVSSCFLILLLLIISLHFLHFSVLTCFFIFSLHGSLKCLALLPPLNHCKHTMHCFSFLFLIIFPFIHTFSCLVTFDTLKFSLQCLHFVLLLCHTMW